jgi:hypothetical protein
MTNGETEMRRYRRHPPRDGMDPDTAVWLDCGHSQMLYNNIRSDPAGWRTWCFRCDRERVVTSAHEWHPPTGRQR